MLKASFSGNVENHFLLKRVFLIALKQKEQTKQRFACHRFAQTQIQIRSSSFSARFSRSFQDAAAATVTATASNTTPIPTSVRESDSSSCEEGGMEEDVSSQGDAGAWKHLDDRRQIRSMYLPWARIVPPGERTSIQRRTEAKRARQERIAASEGQHHVEPGKVPSQDRELGQRSEFQNTLLSAAGVAATVDKGSLFDYVETEEGMQTLDENTGGSRKNIVSVLDTVGEGVCLEDLSIEQLRAIILDKRSDLMGLAWDAYQRLVSIDAEGGSYPDGLFGVELLTTLANRLVAQRKYHRKKCREIFLRLLSVYARLRRERGQFGGAAGVPYLRTVEWNCLIHFAGTGMRGKTPLEAYNAALDVYDDLRRDVEDAKTAGCDSLLSQISPDIYTYTSLLNIALCTEHQPAIDHATKLLSSSGICPSRVTHLCMMRHRFMRGGLLAVRELLLSLRPEEIGSDGVTAYMMCFGDAGDVDTVRNIYAALRDNVEEHDDGTYGPHAKDRGCRDGIEANEAEQCISVEGIRIPRSLVPTDGLYNYVIQILAYHGRLTDALQVFTDMLSTRKPCGKGTFFQPNFVVFRGLFLGFWRNTYKKHRDSRLNALRSLTENEEWTWERFCFVLDSFIDHGDRFEPTERMVHWIMAVVRRLSGDEETHREVWQRLNARWKIRNGRRFKIFDSMYGEAAQRTD